MTERRMRDSATITLDASGNGTATIQVPSGQTWDVKLCTVRIPSPTLIPECDVYVGSVVADNLVDATYTGSLDSTGRIGIVYSREKIIAVWIGGDIGAKATMTVKGLVLSGA